MKTIESILHQLTGYLISIKRNTVQGWYELEIGIYKNWVFNENTKIGVEVISESDGGKILKIFPKNNKVVIDDLIAFVEVILETNKKIAEKEKEFTEKMEEMKKKLEDEAKNFYKQLDDLKVQSFKNMNENLTRTPISGDEIKTEKRGRKPKEKLDLNQFKSPGIPVKESDSTEKNEISSND